MADNVALDPKELKKQEKQDQDFLGTLQGWHDAAKKNRMKLDWKWYLNDNYYRGNHYIQYNKRTQQIVIPPRPKGQVRLVVNKIYSNCRAIRNFATSYRPRWEVVATSTSEEVINSGEKSQETLDYYYDYLKMPKKIKGSTLHAIKYGVGYFQYGWDDDAVGLDRQMGEVDVWVRDPFDVYPDPAGMMTDDIQNCRFIDIAVSKPIQEIVNNPHYSKKVKLDDIQSDTKSAASEFKQILIQDTLSPTFEGSKDLGTKILHETWYKKAAQQTITIHEKDAEGKDITHEETIQTVEVWVASWIEGHLLRNEKTEFQRYPIVSFSSDNNPNEIVGEGYIKNLIPIAKVRNRLESQVVEYNNQVNRGRLIADKNAGVSKITNQTGEIIEKNPGSDVREFRMGGLSGDMDRQISRMDNYDSDISGVQEAFMGRVPEGVKSGVGMESLKAQTANNLQDLKDNLEEALGELGQGILELVANHVIAPRTIRAVDKAGKKQYFKIKGQVGVDPGEKIAEDTYVIGNQNEVKVVIGSGLAYTREGRITRLDKLLEQGVIDPQTYLEHLEFGDVETIMERVRDTKASEAALEAVKAKSMQPPAQGPQMGAQGGTAPQGGQLGQPGGDNYLKLAEDENMAMANGETIPPTKGAPKEHTSIHVAYSQSDEAQNNEDLLRRLLDHVQGEEAEQGMPQMPAPAEGAQNGGQS